MLVVEILGATSTITYGLNIVCDPVHEQLEYEPDAPGITKVCPCSTCHGSFCVQLSPACKLKVLAIAKYQRPQLVILTFA